MLENVFSKVYIQILQNVAYLKFILPFKNDKSGPNVRNGGHLDDVILPETKVGYFCCGGVLG